MGRDSHHAGTRIYAVHNRVKDYCAMHNELLAWLRTDIIHVRPRRALAANMTRF